MSFSFSQCLAIAQHSLSQDFICFHPAVGKLFSLLHVSSHRSALDSQDLMYLCPAVGKLFLSYTSLAIAQPWVPKISYISALPSGKLFSLLHVPSHHPALDFQGPYVSLRCRQVSCFLFYTSLATALHSIA